MKKYLTLPNVYIVLWLLYYLQSTIFGASGTIYSQIIIFALLVISLYYMYIVVANYSMPKYMKGLTVFLGVQIIYGIISMITTPIIYRLGGGSIEARRSLQNVLISLTPIYAFFVFTRQGKLNENKMQFWAIVLVVVSVIHYYSADSMLRASALEAGTGQEEFTNNAGYGLLVVFPAIALLKEKRVLQYILYAVMSVYILMAMKRGAILIAGICIVWFIFKTLKTAKNAQKIVIVFLSMIILIVMYAAFSNMMSTSDYFVQRLNATKEGDDSNRSYIYSTLWNIFLNEDRGWTVMFGYGSDGTLKVYGGYAHNDWLELLINMGCFGVFLYIVYFICFVTSVRCRRKYGEVYMSLVMALIICFMRTIFSMSFGDMPVALTMCIGYGMGFVKERNQEVCEVGEPLEDNVDNNGTITEEYGGGDNEKALITNSKERIIG